MSEHPFGISPAIKTYYDALTKDSVELFLGVVKSLSCTDRRKRRRSIKVEAAYQQLKKKGSIDGCGSIFLSKLPNQLLLHAMSKELQSMWFYKLMQYDYMLTMDMSVSWGFDYEKPTRVLTVHTIHNSGANFTAKFSLI